MAWMWDCPPQTRGLQEIAAKKVLEANPEISTALLTLKLLAAKLQHTPKAREAAVERVKRRCVFTTHTPCLRATTRSPSP